MNELMTASPAGIFLAIAPYDLEVVGLWGSESKDIQGAPMICPAHVSDGA